MQPDLKIIIFTSALISDTTDNSVWTVSALDILIPAVRQVMLNSQPLPSLMLPKKSESLIGDYYLGASVTFSKDGMYLSFCNQGGNNCLNITSFNENATGGAKGMVRANDDEILYPTKVHSTNNIACRWFDDGPDSEILYFVFKAEENDTSIHKLTKKQNVQNSMATGLIFMGERLNRIS